MKYQDGKPYRLVEYNIQCFDCSNTQSLAFEGVTKTYFIGHILTMGWKEINKSFFCPDCVKRYENNNIYLR